MPSLETHPRYLDDPENTRGARLWQAYTCLLQYAEVVNIDELPRLRTKDLHRQLSDVTRKNFRDHGYGNESSRWIPRTDTVAALPSPDDTSGLVRVRYYSEEFLHSLEHTFTIVPDQANITYEAYAFDVDIQAVGPRPVRIEGPRAVYNDFRARHELMWLAVQVAPIAMPGRDFTYA